MNSQDLENEAEKQLEDTVFVLRKTYPEMSREEFKTILLQSAEEALVKCFKDGDNPVVCLFCYTYTHLYIDRILDKYFK